MATNPPIEEIQACVKTLREGGLILYPTDTVWGIGCDAVNNEAVNKIFSLKKREAGKSMLILASDINMVSRYVMGLPEIAVELFDNATTPLTLILPEAVNLARDVPASDQSVGIRIPHDAFCLEVLKTFRRPIVSTSANFSGEPSPSWFGEINPVLIEKMDFVVKWKREDHSRHLPSSIIRINTDGSFRIIRLGGAN